MFYILKQPGRLVCFVNFLLLKNQRLVNAIRPYSYFVNHSSQIRICSAGQCKGFLVSNDQSRLTLSRSKHGRKKNKQKPQDEESSDEEEEDFDDDDDVFGGTDLRTYKLNSLRIDGVLKAVLGISRSKIEKAFYQNKIRVNGEIVQKKSQNAKINDELDLIKGLADVSSSITVGRVKILKVQPDPDTGVILVKAWRSKSLTIENYHDKNAWKEPTAEE